MFKPFLKIIQTMLFFALFCGCITVFAAVPSFNNKEASAGDKSYAKATWLQKGGLTIQAQLGASPYTIHLVDLRPYVKDLFNKKANGSLCCDIFAQAVCKPEDITLFHLDMNTNKGFNVFGLNSASANQCFSFFDEHSKDKDSVSVMRPFGVYPGICVAEYGLRVKKTLEAMKKINTMRNWQLRLNTIPEGRHINYLTRLVSHVDEYIIIPRIGDHPRASLFDMFSFRVDELLHAGIAETVMYNDKQNVERAHEKHLQISLFGILSGKDGDDVAFALPGFFQYTFNLQGICYHRAFRPWTKYHLHSVSNAKTQAVMRLAALNYLNSLESFPAMEKAKTALLQACYDCKDHKNLFFDDQMITEKCCQLRKQIAECAFIKPD